MSRKGLGQRGEGKLGNRELEEAMAVSRGEGVRAEAREVRRGGDRDEKDL